MGVRVLFAVALMLSLTACERPQPVKIIDVTTTGVPMAPRTRAGSDKPSLPVITAEQRDQLCGGMWKMLDADGETAENVRQMEGLVAPSPERIEVVAANAHVRAAHVEAVAAMQEVCPR